VGDDHTESEVEVSKRQESNRKQETRTPDQVLQAAPLKSRTLDQVLWAAPLESVHPGL